MLSQKGVHSRKDCPRDSLSSEQSCPWACEGGDEFEDGAHEAVNMCSCVCISFPSQLKQKFSHGSLETNSNLIHIEKHMTGYLQKHILVKK